jgi:chromosome segregation ATPase
MPRDSVNSNNLPVQDQLDEILALLRSQGSDIADTKKMLVESQAKVTHLKSEVISLKREVKKLKESSKDRDQYAKSRSVRLFGYPTSEEETRTTDGGKIFQNKLYDRIIKPCLKAAKVNGDISSTPQFSTAIEQIYRMGKSANPGRPAPVLITFT